MNVTWSGFAFPGASVDAGSVFDPRVGRRHERFVREKLVLTGLVLAALPLGLAFGGVPNLTEAAFFALALMPLAAALLMARNGRLLLANSFAIMGEIAIAVLLAAVAGAGAAFAWLVLAGIETAMIAPPRLLRATLPMFLAAASAVLAVDGCWASARAAEASLVAGLCASLAAGLAAWRLREVVGANDGAARIAGTRERALLELTRDAVASFDGAGRLNADIAGCTALLGCRREQLRGRGFLDLVNVADRPLFLKLIGDAAHGAGTVGGMLRLHLPATVAKPDAGAAPRTIDVEIRARAAGRDIVVLLRDATQDHRRQREIEAAQRSTDAAVLTKNHFLANMSHELRTPLNAIIGFSELLGSRTTGPSDPAKQREYAGIIHQSGKHLLAIVNAILDLSKIQAGTFVLLAEPFAMRPLAEQCCDAVRLQAQNGRVDVVCDVPDDLEEIDGDRRAYRQMLDNLLTNAVKFTPEHGRVTLRVRPDGTAVCINVVDTGIGIGEADLARLGAPFFQAGSSSSRSYEGTGLGLAVVRGLVGLHGGTIAIESAIGAGTIVTLRLPMDQRTAVPDASAMIHTIPRRGSNDPVRLFEPRHGGLRPPAETRMKKRA